MPGGKLHRAITRRLVGTDGREVHQILDSTVRARGPAHRRDRIHSVEGVMLELARRGKLTPQNLLAAQLHILTDEVMSEFYRRVLPRGIMRRPAQELLEAVMVRALRPKRRR